MIDFVGYRRGLLVGMVSLCVGVGALSASGADQVSNANGSGDAAQGAAPQANSAQPKAPQPNAGQGNGSRGNGTGPQGNGTPATGAPPAEESVATAVTPELLQGRISQTETNTELTEALKAELLGLYRQALEQLHLATGWQSKSTEFETGRLEAPALVEDARKRLADLSSKPAASGLPDVSPDTKMSDLVQRQRDAEADLTNKQTETKRLEAESRQRSDRRAALPQVIADANKRLEAINATLSTPPTEGVSPQLVEARRWLSLAKRRATETEIRTQQQELQFYDARSELLAARREEAKLLEKHAESLVTFWQGVVSQRREAEAQQQKAQANEDLKSAPAPIRDLAERNAALAEEQSTLAKLIADSVQKSQSVAQLGEQLGKDFTYLRENATRAGMEDLIGSVMRNKRVELQGYARYEREFEETKREFGRVQLRLMEIEEERLGLTDIESDVAAALAQIQNAAPAVKTERIEPKVRELLESRQNLLLTLKRDYEAHATDLIQLTTSLATLMNRLEQLEGIIQEHVLWIRSSPPLYRMDPTKSVDDMIEACRKTGREALADFDAAASQYLFVGAVLILLLAYGMVNRRTLFEMSENVARASSDAPGLTPVALLLAMVISLPLPALMWFLSMRYSHVAADRGSPTGALAGAFGVTALALLSVRYVQVLSRPKGIIDRQFRWDSRAVRILRRNLAWFLPVSIPLLFILSFAEHYFELVLRDFVGRMAFIALMLALAGFARRVLHPHTGVVAIHLAKRPTTWSYRYRHLWHIVFVAGAMAAAVGSFIGFHFTAVEFAKRAAVTIWIGVGVLFGHAILTRWVFYSQRKLALADAKRRKEAADTPDPPKPTVSETVVAALDDEDTLVNIGDQAKRLISTSTLFVFLVASWFIWDDLLPALSFMNEFHVWEYATSRVVIDADPNATPRTIPTIGYISLANLAAALVIGMITMALARNIPGILEIAILRSSALDHGARFAITTVSRYVIVTIGLVSAFGAVGVAWSNVQWLVAAMTVGLGFGLQEIFANFVSGLMLLVERPIRVGDTVTVGDVSGTISRIRIRATTITGWDRKELVIPNKEFITGQVINWTLSDSVQRLVLPVGIAYGSDVDLAMSTLERIAREDQKVCEDPAPYVVFQAFGDNSLNIELRVFIPTIDELIGTRDRINRRIDREFRNADIEIAFPQRDIHIRSIDASLPIATDPKTLPATTEEFVDSNEPTPSEPSRT